MSELFGNIQLYTLLLQHYQPLNQPHSREEIRPILNRPKIASPFNASLKRKLLTNCVSIGSAYNTVIWNEHNLTAVVHCYLKIKERSIWFSDRI